MRCAKLVSIAVIFMRNILYVLCITMLMSISVTAQTSRPSTGATQPAATPPPETTYRVFDGQGNPSSLQAILDSAEKVDVVFLGENHDDSVAHGLQTQIFGEIVTRYMAKRKIALSLEMFERDVQIELNEYLDGLISETHFMSSTRPWGNYKTDYRPLVELAKEKKLPVIAANAPRRYVNMVSRNGRDSLNALTPEAKRWLAPLPFGKATDDYRKKFEALMGGSGDANRLGLSKIVESQSLWDATMAYSIAEFLKTNKQPLAVHLNGSFHSEKRWGIPDHLVTYVPQVKFVVITMRYEEDFTNFNKEKHTDLGDFVILTDAKQPRSGK